MLIKEIKNYFDTKNFDFFYYNSVNSTMEIAKKKLRKKNLCIVSNMQTNGIGRRGSKWISPEGNLYLSYLIKYNLEIKNHFIFTAAIASSVCELVKKVCKVDSFIKWPNDIIINNSKISGIISELYSNNNQNYIILGVGINIISSPKVDDYKTAYTAFYNKKINKENLILNLSKIFFNKYDLILCEDYKKIILNYKKHLKHLGKIINIELNNNISPILFEDINYDGSILANINGINKNIYSARILDDSI